MVLLNSCNNRDQTRFCHSLTFTRCNTTMNYQFNIIQHITSQEYCRTELRQFAPITEQIQRTNGPDDAHLTSGHPGINTILAILTMVLKWSKVIIFGKFSAFYHKTI